MPVWACSERATGPWILAVKVRADPLRLAVVGVRCCPVRSITSRRGVARNLPRTTPWEETRSKANAPVEDDLRDVVQVRLEKEVASVEQFHTSRSDVALERASARWPENLVVVPPDHK